MPRDMDDANSAIKIYEVEKILGEGSYGKVKLAYDSIKNIKV